MNEFNFLNEFTDEQLEKKELSDFEIEETIDDFNNIDDELIYANEDDDELDENDISDDLSF
jgi:hypothetical protein